MDGPSLMNFAIAAVPQVIDDILQTAGLSPDEIDLYLLHQATLKMMEQLQQRLGLTEERLPVCLRDCGNTVSSTIPILIDRPAEAGSYPPGQQEHADWLRGRLVLGRVRLDGMNPDPRISTAS